MIKSLKVILSYSKSKKIWLLFAFVIITVALGLSTPIIIGQALDFTAGKNDVNFVELNKLLVVLISFVATAAVFQWVISVLNIQITQTIVNPLRKSCFDKLNQMPIIKLDELNRGDVLNTMTIDIETLSEGILTGISQLFSGALTIIATLIFMFYLNYIIALIVMVLTPISMVVTYIMAKSKSSLFTKTAESQANLSAFCEEYLSNRLILQSFNCEKEFFNRFSAINEQLKVDGIKSQYSGAKINPIARCINYTVLAVVIAVGANLCLGGSLSVGSLGALISYSIQYAKPFNDISAFSLQFSAASAAFERILKLLEIPNEQDTTQLGKLNIDETCSVEFKNLGFSYETEKPLITDFNLFAERGQKIAIVGATGSGKTTLLNLLMRFYRAQQGQILLDGVDIADVNSDELRSNFGMVLQDSVIFNASVADNIRFGNPNATMDDIINISKMCCIDSFVAKMKDGYDTIIHENSNLSIGQKQLICIARVMLCNPKIVILDEATSGIDTLLEQLIQQMFEKMCKNRTSFIVAHRLSTIREADKIVVVSNGQIMETGNHHELLAKKGYYYNLLNAK